MTIETKFSPTNNTMQDTPSPSILLVLQSLDEYLEKLHAVISETETKFTPVTKEPRPVKAVQAGDKSKEPSHSSLLLNTGVRLVEKVQCAITRLAEFQERCEL